MSRNAVFELPPLPEQIQVATDAGLRQIAAGRKAHLAVLTFAHSVSTEPGNTWEAVRELGGELRAAGELLRPGTCSRSQAETESKPLMSLVKAEAPTDGESPESADDVAPAPLSAVEAPPSPVVEGAVASANRVEFLEDPDGVRFQVVAGDGVLATSGLFDDERRAGRAAQSFLRAAASAAQLVTQQDSDDSWFFVVRARNNRTLWTSAEFDSEDAALAAVAELHAVAVNLQND